MPLERVDVDRLDHADRVQGDIHLEARAHQRQRCRHAARLGDGLVRVGEDAARDEQEQGGGHQADHHRGPSFHAIASSVACESGPVVERPDARVSGAGLAGRGCAVGPPYAGVSGPVDAVRPVAERVDGPCNASATRLSGPIVVRLGTTGPARLCAMDHTRFAAWLRGYIDAWRTGDRAAVEALFTEDARYAFAPFRPPLLGRDAIVEMWLKEPDAPGSWTADYRPLAVDGHVAVAHGRDELPQGRRRQPGRGLPQHLRLRVRPRRPLPLLRGVVHDRAAGAGAGAGG